MKRFLKDNLAMLIVLGVAFLAAVALLVLVILEHNKMYNYFQQAGELREKIASLIKQKPAPVSGNIDPIQKNTEQVKGKTEEVRKYFGQVRVPALEAFVKVLGVSLPDFREQFRTEWEADNNRHALGGRDRFYQRFKMKYPKWGQAVQAFQQEYQKYSVEKIDDTNVDAVLLSALGIPRNMDNDPEKAMRYMWQMRSNMVDTLTKENKEFRFLGDSAAFSFDYKTNPLPADIPAIVKNWGIIADLGSRIAKADMDSLSTFTHRNLAGEQVGNFKVYHYTFTVHGSLEKIRNLVKIINDAYKDRRFYIVRSVFLYAENDGAKNVFLDRAAEAERLRLEIESSTALDDKDKDKEQGFDGRPQTGRNPMTGPATSAPMDEKEAEKAQAALAAQNDVSSLPYDKRPGYGKVLFGGKGTYEAVFDVEYVTLAEPELN